MGTDNVFEIGKFFVTEKDIRDADVKLFFSIFSWKKVINVHNYLFKYWIIIKTFFIYLFFHGIDNKHTDFYMIRENRRQFLSQSFNQSFNSQLPFALCQLIMFIKHGNGFT
jgi:hypothetical protein